MKSNLYQLQMTNNYLYISIFSLPCLYIHEVAVHFTCSLHRRSSDLMMSSLLMYKKHIVPNRSWQSQRLQIKFKIRYLYTTKLVIDQQVHRELYSINIYRQNICTLKPQPPIAQLVERETVDYIQNQISLGRWFKSGSVDIFLDLVFKIRTL